MARLYTVGYESQILSSNASQGGEADPPAVTFTQNGVPVINTAVARSGAACGEYPQGAANWNSVVGLTMVLDRAYFIRAYVRFSDATPASQSQFLNVITTGTPASVRLNTDGTIAVHDSAGTQVGSASSGLSDNTWYRVELKIIIPTAGSGTVELKLDGSTVASSAAAAVTNSVASPVIRFGSVGAAGSGTTYVDDFAINDDQGATSQNTYPGSGKVILLKPTSDSAIGTWVGPQTTGDDTTNLFDNVDNTPPVGVTHSDLDAEAGKYVFNITNSANQNFDVNCQTYTAGGIVASDTIKVCQALGRMSCNTTTGTNTGAVSGVSNPACTATTGRNLETVAIAGTEPTGWKTVRSAIAADPSVTLGTAPVVRASKEVANTNAAMVDLMGLLVDYEPAFVAPTVRNLATLGVG